jgi:hypothetical protein
MSKKETGGPAFPVAFTTTPLQGMSLRDYFAAKALHMIGAGNTQEDLATWDYKHFAEYAYALADAMLLERAK